MWSHIFVFGSLPRRRPPEFTVILMFEFWREATAVSVPGLLRQSGRRRPEISLMLQCWRRTGHLPSFFVPPQDIWQFKSPHPREFAIQGKKKKMLMPGGWGFWAQMELTDASQRRQQVNWVWIRPILIEFMERFLSRYSRSGFPFRRQE